MAQIDREHRCPHSRLGSNGEEPSWATAAAPPHRLHDQKPWVEMVLE